MNTPRVLHSSTRLLDGRVLIAGGLEEPSGAHAAVAEIYDSDANTWLPAGTMGKSRFSHTATLLADGRVLVAGGYSFNAPFPGIGLPTEIFDPADNSWTDVADLLTPRVDHTATLLPDGNVLVVGGHNNLGTVYDSTEIYDPALDRWTVGPSLLETRAQHTASALGDGRVLITGGSGSTYPLVTSEIYDPGANTWTSAAALNHGRYLHGALALASGRVLVVGGVDAPLNSLSSAEIYDPGVNEWVSIAPMLDSRVLFALTLLDSGEVMVVAGQTSQGQLTQHAEILRSESDLPPPTPEQLDSLLTELVGVGAVDDQVFSSLRARLRVAASALEAGRCDQAGRAYARFSARIESYRGDEVTDDAATLLIETADAVSDSCSSPSAVPAL